MSCGREADFVVIGMGAGGALVLRMLKDAGFSAIGLESGVNYDKDPLISESTNAGIIEEQYGWKFFYQRPTINNKDLATTEHPNGRHLNYTTGRMLGGGTSINGMQYVRSPSEYWDRYAAINGSRWNSTHITNAYIQLENFFGVPGAYNPSVHGENGKMQIRQAPVTPSAQNNKFVTALSQASGQPIIDDYNNPATPLGVFTRWSLFQNKDGTRASSSTDFLQPVMRDVITGATVNKILLDSCGRASSVEVIIDGVCTRIRARKEIIICCGIYSAELLQRSGVGDSAYLSSIGVNTIYHNPSVGKNLKNHMINIALFSANPSDYPGTGGDPNSLYVGGAFLPEEADSSKRGSQWIGVSISPGLFAVIFYVLHVQSTGDDRIQSKDPFTQGRTNEMLLNNPADLNEIIRLYQTTVLSLNEKFQAIDPSYKLIDPPPELIKDTERLTVHIKNNIDHTHHWTGTCSMAPLNLGGVVDNRGKVYGVKGLRVADGSVLPIQARGNTAAPATVAAYVIARSIIEEYSIEY